VEKKSEGKKVKVPDTIVSVKSHHLFEQENGSEKPSRRLHRSTLVCRTIWWKKKKDLKEDGTNKALPPVPLSYPSMKHQM